MSATSTSKMPFPNTRHFLVQHKGNKLDINRTYHLFGRKIPSQKTGIRQKDFYIGNLFLRKSLVIFRPTALHNEVGRHLQKLLESRKSHSRESCPPRAPRVSSASVADAWPCRALSDAPSPASETTPSCSHLLLLQRYLRNQSPPVPFISKSKKQKPP